MCILKPIENDDDEFPYSSPDLTPSLPPPAAGSPEPGQLRVEEVKTVMHLAVGTALEGSDEFQQRVRLWQQSVRDKNQAGMPSLPSEIYPGEDETDGERLLYAIIGLLFRTPDLLSSGFSFVNRITFKASSFTARVFAPLTRSRMMRPVRGGSGKLVRRGQSVIDALVDAGRAEERVSRTLVRQQVTDETISELMNYLVEKARLRELIQEQSLDVAGDAMSELRGRSADVDLRLENAANTILRRNRGETPPTETEIIPAFPKKPEKPV